MPVGVEHKGTSAVWVKADSVYGEKLTPWTMAGEAVEVDYDVSMPPTGTSGRHIQKGNALEETLLFFFKFTDA